MLLRIRSGPLRCLHLGDCVAMHPQVRICSGNRQAEETRKTSGSLYDLRRSDGNSAPERLVRLAYFDHAGSSSIKDEPVGITASLLVHGDREWRLIERYRDALIEDAQWGLTEEQRLNFEFHAKDLFWSGKSPFKKWTKEKRHDLLEGFVKLIPKFNLPIFLGAIDRAGFRLDYATEGRPLKPNAVAAEELHTFFECAYSIDSWMKVEIDDEVAICIFDRADEDIMLGIKQNLRKYRHYSARMRGLMWFPHLVEIANFADPKESFGLELADSCSFFVKRHLMDTDDTDADSERFFKLLEPQIVQPAGGLEFSANPWGRLKKDYWPKANRY